MEEKWEKRGTASPSRAAKKNSKQLEPSNFKKNDGDGHTLKVNKDRKLLFLLKLHKNQD
jgi:hypothetical protein